MGVNYKNDKNLRINERVKNKLEAYKIKLTREKGTYFSYSDAIMYLLEEVK